jgi:hypothetical protein
MIEARGADKKLVWFHDSDVGEDPVRRRLPATSGPRRPSARMHGAQPEAVDDCRVRHRAAAPAAVLVRLISCR